MIRYELGKKSSCKTYHSDSIVKKWLAEDDNVENFIDMNLLEHGENGDRIYGGN